MDPLYPKILTTNPHDERWMKVSDLIGEHGWKEDAVNSLFIGRDVEQILRLPISQSGLGDRRIWRGTSQGKFAVKSAYVLAKEWVRSQRRSANLRGQSSGEQEDVEQWKRIWHIKAPMKIRFFIWKCLQNILALNNNLHHRKLPVDCLCPVCGLEPETVDHMLFRCDRATKTWLLSPFRFRPEEMRIAKLQELWSKLGKIEKNAEKWETLGLLAFVFWNIWKAKNEWVFKRARAEETKIISNAMAEFHEFCEQDEDFVHGGTTQVEGSSPRWNPPDLGLIKVNVDGAFLKETGRGGVELAWRNDQGNLLRMDAIPIPKAQSPEMVEALGFQLAAKTIFEIGGSNYILEGDAQRVIKMLHGTNATSANLEIVIQDTLIFVDLISSLSFNFVSRNCNRVANALAKYALSIDCPVTQVGDFPTWVQQEVSLDS